MDLAAEAREAVEVEEASELPEEDQRYQATSTENKV